MSRRVSVGSMVAAAACFIVFVSPPGSLHAQARIDLPPSESPVVMASEQWFEAISRGDVKALEDLELDNFLSFQQTARGLTMTTKQAQLDQLRTGSPANRVKLQRELGSTRIRTYGNVAIMTAVATYRGQDASGKSIVTQALVTEIWVNEAGKWRISHFQPFTIPPRPGTPAAPARPPAK